MAKLREVEITYAGQTEKVWARNPRYTTVMRLFGFLREGMDAKDGKVDMSRVPTENIANYQINLIAESVTDADGKKLYTPDDVDSWVDADREAGMEKIRAYALALEPKNDKETAAGN